MHRCFYNYKSYLFNSRTSLPGTSASNTDSSEEYRREFSTQSTGRDFQSHEMHLRFSPPAESKLHTPVARFYPVPTCSLTHSNQQVACTVPLTSEGYKQVAVIGVVSSHRSGGYKHISDKLCLNGGRKQPSAPVQASLTLLPRNNQAALLQQVQAPELIFGELKTHLYAKMNTAPLKNKFWKLLTFPKARKRTENPPAVVILPPSAWT